MVIIYKINIILSLINKRRKPPNSAVDLSCQFREKYCCRFVSNFILETNKITY